MIFWKVLSTWSHAANLDDLVASIPFPASQVETVEVGTFLEQSRFSNSQCEEVIRRVFVLGLCS
jgi:hydroxymethylglutaryl-CoA reductase